MRSLRILHAELRRPAGIQVCVSTPVVVVVVSPTAGLARAEFVQQLWVARVGDVVGADAPKTVVADCLAEDLLVVAPMGNAGHRGGERLSMRSNVNPHTGGLLKRDRASDPHADIDVFRITRVADIEPAVAGRQQTLRTARPHGH